MAKKDNGAGFRSGEPSYIEKLRSHKLTILYRSLLTVTLLAALCFLAYFNWRDKTYREVVVVRTAPIREGGDAEFLALGGNMLQYSKDGILCMNAGGEQLWNQTYEMQSPIVRTCRDTVAVGDYNGHMIYIADTGGLIGSIDTNLPIRNLCVAAQGVVAAVLDDRDDAWIYLYDAQGSALAYFKTSMGDSGYPVAVAISPNGQLVAVSFLYADDGRIKTSIAFYNFGTVGQNAVDNYVSGYDYTGVVVPYLEFMDDTRVCAVSGDRVMFYEGAQIPTSQAEHLTAGEEIAGVYTGNGHIGLLFHNSTGGGAYRLQVYGAGGDLLTSIAFDQVFSDVLLLKDRIVIYGPDEWHLYDMQGNEKYGGPFPDSVRRLAPTEVRTRFMAVTGASIQTLELR